MYAVDICKIRCFFQYMYIDPLESISKVHRVEFRVLSAVKLLRLFVKNEQY